MAWTDGFDLAIRTSGSAVSPRDGLPLLVEQQVNNPSPFVFGNHQSPSLDADADGHIVVVWESQNGCGPELDDQGAAVQRGRRAPDRRAAGEPDHDRRAAQAGRGRRSRRQLRGGLAGVRSGRQRQRRPRSALRRRRHAAGRPVPGEPDHHRRPAAAVGGPRRRRTVRGRLAEPGPGRQQLAAVFARRFDATGSALGNEFRANTATFERQERPVGRRWCRTAASSSSGRAGARRAAGPGRLRPALRRGRRRGRSRVPRQHRDAGPSTAARGHRQPRGGFVVTWAQQQYPPPRRRSSRIRPRSSPTYGPASTPPSEIPNDLIFADGFETGDLSRWSAAATDGGDLSVTPQAALAGTFGLQAMVDDTASLYVQDNSPDDEPRYRARFAFHPKDFDPGEAVGGLPHAHLHRVRGGSLRGGWSPSCSGGRWANTR